MTNVMRYTGLNSGRAPSPSIWAKCPWREIVDGTVDGVWDYQDFSSGGKITSPTTEAALIGLPLSGFGSGSTTITYDVTKASGGAIVLTTPATDDTAVTLRSAQSSYQLSGDAGSLWMEARLKVNSVTTLVSGFFVGFAEATAGSATFPLTATTGAFADANVFGFHRPIANTTTFNVSYKADSVTQVDLITGTGTLAADTYIKFGMFYSQRTGRINFFVNGTRVALTATESTTISAKLGKTLASNTGTDTPSDVAMNWIVEVVAGSAAASILTLDWIRTAQLGSNQIAGA